MLRILDITWRLLLMVCDLFQLSSQSDVHNNAVQIFDLLAKALLIEHVDYAIGKCFLVLLLKLTYMQDSYEILQYIVSFAFI